MEGEERLVRGEGEEECEGGIRVEVTRAAVGHVSRVIVGVRGRVLRVRRESRTLALGFTQRGVGSVG